MIKSVLIDARNWASLKHALLSDLSQSGLVGFDIETEDSDRHQGLNEFMADAKGKKLVFDVNRTVITGFSWYCDKADTAYYLNLAHADVENRIPWSEARQLLEAKKEGAHWICHNAPYELTMMFKSLGFELGDTICTLQMAVSCFNEDQYPQDKMLSEGLGGMKVLSYPIAKAFGRVNKDLNEEQFTLLNKVVGKTTTSAFSYNGYCREIGYGYGLKKLTKSLFGYEQTSFDTVMAGREHMGMLTGDEVCSYGAEDAYWAVRIFHELLPRIMAQNDKLLDTFLTQENPMIHVYSDIWRHGIRIDRDAVFKAQASERAEYATALREMQAIVRARLPFPEGANEVLFELDSWYSKNPTGYRKKIEAWAKLKLSDDDFKAVYTTAGPVTKSWAKEHGLPVKPLGPNLSYYMTARTLMYDLTGLVPLVGDGKVLSDADAREKLKGRGIDDLLEAMGKLAGIETRMKLYLNPYLQLIDPETGLIHPTVSSMLNSRRMAMKDPNGMQLAKRGPGKYIRGFYLADADDEVIVSLDWSQIELVEIGDFSQDTGFAEAYGQIPYKDLHWKAAASGMGMTVAEVKALPNAKDIRTNIGKGSNFNYWYSGALNTVGETMGWTSDEMWAKTEAYRLEFPEAEQWRLDLISESREKGYVTLPDGHRRVKFEASYSWRQLWQERWDSTGNPGMSNFGVWFCKKIHNRAGNQIVNSMIQGTCATLAKRSILRLRVRCAELKLRVRFMMPIHDELVFSVHKDDVILFLREARRIMCDHPDIIKHLKMDATASLGRTFEPFSKTAPLGQVELDEAPEILGFKKDSKLNETEVQTLLDYMFKEAA